MEKIDRAQKMLNSGASKGGPPDPLVHWITLPTEIPR